MALEASPGACLHRCATPRGTISISFNSQQAGLRTHEWQITGRAAFPHPRRSGSLTHPVEWIRRIDPTLIYRCGGSAGIVQGNDPGRTGFPVNSMDERRREHPLRERRTLAVWG